ncbi:ABC transporter ATP-binding protein [Streptomyces triticirhizae]|uniref:ABC transporter ATP-binding protein n=1 Tax=Streptomyces triticirhizae TaxID=2483353 RepID=A0A3M2LHF4_9ACTN|nr:ABC transporter ATP-binding protein [Streptomyces triticirhizae]RMI36907.1 ABC transporter ATP-binding protein [Streptomyces triticirhizae]
MSPHAPATDPVPATESTGPALAADPVPPPARSIDHSGVRVTGLRRAFDGRVVLDDVELTIAPGEFVSLLGASGSGKSTLLRAVGGLDPGVDGRIEVPERTAIVFQEHRLLPWERVWRNVTLGVGGGDLRRRAVAALAEVGLEGRADAWPGTLSGGESQRVALARALVRTPQLLLLDEPFGALDALTRLTAQALVEDLWAEHRPSVLLVTHDVEEALLLSDRALLLANGRIAAEFTVDIPRPRPLDHPRLVELRTELLAGLGVHGPARRGADRATEETATPRSATPPRENHR